MQRNKMGRTVQLCLFVAFTCLGWTGSTPVQAQDNARGLQDPASPAANWDGNTSGLFRKGMSEAGLSFGPGWGLPMFGSRMHHNWFLGRAELGWMLSDVVAKDRWYRGTWQIMTDLFGGFQYHPDHAYVVGISPMLRYNFVTGTRWVPYVSAGAGFTATDIRDGDLSTEFEFNLRIGPGLRYFFNEKLAANLHYQLIHISNAGMDVPNSGLNNSTIFVGVSWLF